jgi:hypothetical protein
MSFGWTGFFRQGAWQTFRRFVLDERRDALARISAINAELVRIGEVRVLYARTDPSDPNSPMSESRIGLDVASNSSLERLLQAYIAQGGNPFDISMFLTPDSFETVAVDEEGVITEVRETQPYGGILSPRTADPQTPGLYTGGWLPLWRYPPRKFGNNITYVSESAEMTPVINAAREWLSQEIRTKRNDLEARIIKQCDLREQLIKERDEILPQAVGGVIPGIPFGDNFAISFHVSSIVKSIDEIFYPLQEDGTYDFLTPRETANNPPYPVLLEDATTGEEDWSGLG